MSYSSTTEKLYLTFCLKNCLQKVIYKISALIEDSQSKYKENIKTEERQCFQNNSLIIFSKKMLCNFLFERNQAIKIGITKIINNDKEIIERMTSLSSLISSPNSIYERKINNKESSEILCIKLDRENMNLYENNSLFEYFKSGLKLSCFISLDFSNIKLSPSLIDTKANYVKLLKNISIIFSNYTKEHLFYTYGFGANFLSDKEIFNINLKKNDSKINKIKDVLKYFKLCLINNFIKKESYINLSSLIKKITKEIYKLNEISHYNTAFIIMRGVIDQNDITRTIDSIIESSLLPLTIFIIGVGRNDYSLMNNIFSSNIKFSSGGIEKKRNNAFFFDLIKHFSNNEEKLVSLCAEELSKQIIKYYDLIETTPKDVYEKNFKKIENSFNLYNSSILSSYNPYNLKKEKEKVDKYKKEENPCNNNISLSKSNNNSKNINNINSKMPYDPEYYVNERPKMYDINFINDNNNNSNINCIINNDSNNIKDEENREFVFTPNPRNEDSIYPKIIDNPYCDKNDIKEENKPEDQKLNNNSNSPKKKYKIPNHSIVISNINNNYNPYMRDKTININENIEQSNNYGNYNPYSKNNNNHNNENIEQRNNHNIDYPHFEDKKKQINENIEQSNNNNYTPYLQNNSNNESIQQSSNYDKNYNPFLEDKKILFNDNIEHNINFINYNHSLEDNKNKINENNEQNNNLFGHKKNKKTSDVSELNSTKNSDNVKSSNFFLFNDYSIVKSNMK